MSVTQDFYDVFYGHDEATNFGAMLFRLIAKADFENRERLKKVFPLHVAVYERYMDSHERPPHKVVAQWIEEMGLGT